MAETVNIGEIANKLSEEIFQFFGWKAHPCRDENFSCSNPKHTVKVKPKNGKEPVERKKDTHPGDVVFSYQDPYLGMPIYLHTDLKSYAKNSISNQKIRGAILSLAMTIECARSSANWRAKYSTTDESFEVRGLLFVHNHDGNYKDSFEESLKATNLSTIPIAPNVYIHILGPKDIDRLYTIANDIMRLQHQKILPEKYSCYYPDLVMWRRHGDVFSQPATIEALTAPYFVLTYEQEAKSPPGFIIYYNRLGQNPEEFEYFLDSLSRWQMLEPGKSIKVRVVSRSPHTDLLSHFRAAKEKYAKAWGFDDARIQILDDIRIEQVTAVASNYSAQFIGWRENQ